MKQDTWMHEQTLQRFINDYQNGRADELIMVKPVFRFKNIHQLCKFRHNFDQNVAMACAEKFCKDRIYLIVGSSFSSDIIAFQFDIG